MGMLSYTSKLDKLLGILYQNTIQLVSFVDINGDLISATNPFCTCLLLELNVTINMYCIVILNNVFPALKGTQFYFLFAITAAGVVLCGGPKKSSPTSSIVQITFSVWSFESVMIL